MIICYSHGFLCLPQTVMEELGEGELPREMFVIGEDLNIRPKLLQQVIDEVELLSLYIISSKPTTTYCHSPDPSS